MPRRIAAQEAPPDAGRSDLTPESPRAERLRVILVDHVDALLLDGLKEHLSDVGGLLATAAVPRGTHLMICQPAEPDRGEQVLKVNSYTSFRWLRGPVALPSC